MKLSFTNRDLPALTQLLDSLELSPAPSRARTHLLHALTPHIEAFSQDEYELVKAYARLGDDGEPVRNPDGTITLANPDKAVEFHTEHNQLLAESVSVELQDDKTTTLLTALGSTSQTFHGVQAHALDLLATQLEHTPHTTKEEGS